MTSTNEKIGEGHSDVIKKKIEVDCLDVIQKKIDFGIYTTRKRNGGQYCRVLNDIYTEKNERVEFYFYCTVCKEVIHCLTGKGTAKLNRHADGCDPPEPKKQANVDNDCDDDKISVRDHENTTETSAQSSGESSKSVRADVDIDKTSEELSGGSGKRIRDDADTNETPEPKKRQDNSQVRKTEWTTKFSSDRDELSEVIASASHIFNAFGTIDARSVKNILKRNCTGNVFLMQLTKAVKEMNRIQEPEVVLEMLEQDELLHRTPVVSSDAVLSGPSESMETVIKTTRALRKRPKITYGK